MRSHQIGRTGVTQSSTQTSASSLSLSGMRVPTSGHEPETRDLVIASVAHDLRNPLGAVYAVLDFVLDRLLPTDDAHRMARQQLDIARSAAEQMLHLVTELLEGTTMEASQLTLRVASCDPADIVRAAINELGPLAAQRGITLSCELAPALPCVLVDRPRLARVFSNLGANAIRYTPAGGRISFGAVAQGEAVRFEVSDTGVGIAAHHMPHVFDRFWRADQSSSSGVGLGLAIAKSIVDAHRGQISVESNPGAGSSFSFTIPMATPVRDRPTCTDGNRPIG